VTPAVEAQAEPVKISWTASGALASWRRILAQTIGDKRPNLERASIEILCLAKAEPGSKPAIVDQLAEMAVAAGIDDDEAQAIFARAVKAPRSVAELSIRKNASVTFPLRAFDSVRLQTERRNYLVKGLLANTGLAVIWGPPKCGKSFWAADLGMHIALGWDYRGHKVATGDSSLCCVGGAPRFPGSGRGISPASQRRTMPRFIYSQPRSTWSPSPANSSQRSRLNSEKIFRAHYSWTLSTGALSDRNRKTRTWRGFWQRLKAWHWS
jgi:hypothetical protein